MHTHKIGQKEIEKIVKECFTIADVCRKLGWKPCGGNYHTVKQYFKDYNIDTAHFTGQRTNIGNRLNKKHEKKAEYYLTKNSLIASSVLKKKLFNENIKEYKCERCGLSEWMGEPISLQLHHINGDNTDNRLENIIILCPNCHSQTDNFCGKKNKKEHPPKLCSMCGKELKSRKSKLCPSCSNIVSHLAQRKVERPPKEELLEMVKKDSFESIGRKFGVSGKTIAKWCKSYNLPNKKRDIKLL